jgi:hypothetical protein
MWERVNITNSGKTITITRHGVLAHLVFVINFSLTYSGCLVQLLLKIPLRGGGLQNKTTQQKK